MKKFAWLLCSMILAVSGLLISACGETYNNINLIASSANIEVEIGESRDVVFTIENYRDSISDEVSVSADTANVQISNRVKLGGGKSRFTITGIRGGATSLRAVTYEGGKSTNVNVYVRESVSAISKKQGILFVTVGERFTPTDNNYEFYPAATTQRALKYYVKELGIRKEFTSVDAVEENGQITLSFNGPVPFEITAVHAGKFDFEAVSTANTDLGEITISDECYVLDTLDEERAKIVNRGESEEIQDAVLVTNLQERSEIVVSFVVPSASDILEADFVRSGGTVYVSRTTENFKEVNDNSTTFNFIISTNSMTTGEDKLTFQAFYKGFDGYRIEKSILVKVLLAPKNITINESLDPSQVELYNHNFGNFGSQSLNLGVFPAGANFTGIKVISLGNGGFTLAHNGKTLDLNSTIFDLSKTLYVTGVKDTAVTDSSFVLSVESELLSGNPIIVTVSINIKKGVREIALSRDEYKFDESKIPENQERKGIFLDIRGGEMMFDEFIVTPYDAFVGKFTITPVGGANDIVTVSQIGENEVWTKKLKVRPKREGIATFKISLTNGASVSITFRVFNAFSNSAIGILDYVNIENVKTEIERNPNLGDFNSVVSFAIRNDKNFGSTTVINIFEPFGGEITIEPPDSGSSGIVDVNLSNIDKNQYQYTIKSFKSGDTTVKFKIIGLLVVDFLLEEKIENKELKISSFIGLESLNFSRYVEISSGGTEKISARNIELYYGDLGSDDTLKSMNILPVFEPSEATYFYKPETGEYTNEQIASTHLWFTISGNTKIWDEKDNAVTEMHVSSVSNRGRIYTIGDFVSFDTEKMLLSSTNNAKFSFKMYAKVKQFSKTFTFEINVTSKEYQSVTQVGLYNYLERIDLKATMDEVIISTYVLPMNATNQGVSVIFEKDNGTPSNLIQIERLKINGVETNLFRISYDSKVLEDAIKTPGTRTSGIINIVSSSWIRDGQIIQNGVKLKIAVGTGRIESPFHIGSESELLAIGAKEESLSMHYIVSSALNFSNYSNITPLGAFLQSGTNSDDEPLYKITPFTGSIRGEGNGSITGLNFNTAVRVNSGSEINYYMGLFAELGVESVISDLNISGSLSFNEDSVESGSSLMVGLLAGVNRGKIINSTINLIGADIRVGSQIFFGGVVGKNSGTIISAVSRETRNTNLINMSSEAKLIAASGYVGGVAGQNTGTITWAVSNDVKLYNLAGYMAVVNLNVIFSASVGAVGGIAGSSESEIGTEVNLKKRGDEEYYYYPTWFEVAESPKFSSTIGGIVCSENSNIGGAVGLMNNSQSALENIISRVFVRGNKKVGALVGVISTYKILKNCKVEATDNGERIGRDATLIIRTEPIASDPSSGVFNGAEAGATLWSVLVGNGTFPSTTFGDLKLSLTSYVTRSMELSAIEVDKYCGDLIVLNAEGSINKQYKFRGANIDNFVLDIKNGMNPKSGDASVPRALYLFYYESIDRETQYQLSENNTIRSGEADYPFKLDGEAEISLISENPSVLTFDEQGTIVLHSTGIAKVKVRSVLNAKVEAVIYIYVVHFVKDAGIGTTKVYAAATSNGYLVEENYTISIYTGRPVTLYLILSTNYQTVGNTILELVENNVSSLNIQYYESIDEIGDIILPTKTFTTYSTQGMNYIFYVPAGQTEVGSNNVQMQTVFEVTISGITYVGKIYDPMSVQVVFKKGTTDISFDVDYVEIMSRDEFKLSTRVVTDNEADKLAVSYAKKKIDGTADSYITIWNKDNGPYEENALFEVLRDNANSVLIYNFSIFVRRILGQEDYGEYFLQFTADNGYSETIILNLKQQTYESIIINNYSDEASSQSDNFTTDITVPGKRGILSVMIFPPSSEFIALEVVNGSGSVLTGGAQVAFELVKWNGSGYERFAGYELIAGGIRIPKALITDNETRNIFKEIKIRYMLPTVGVENNIPVVIDFRIVAVDEVNVVPKTLYTQLEAKVQVGIKGKTVVAGDSYRVARGLRYELELDVYGFLESEIYITTSNSSLADIVIENGRYYLQIKENVSGYNSSSEGISFGITSFGVREDGKRSPDFRIELIILDYVLLFSSNGDGNFAGDLFEGMQNGIIRLAVGNKYDFTITLKNGINIEYDDRIQDVREQVLELESSLRLFGFYQVATNLTSNDKNGLPTPLGPSGKYILDRTSAIMWNTKINTIYFYINGFSINPLRINDVNNPTYKIDYEFNFIISNGRYQIVSNNGQTVRTSFIIDTYQRTTLEHPIPITSYAEFINMGADQYYILLEDIVLPSDFTPITTLIKGFDGNSKKITMRGIYEYSERSVLGIFERIPEGSLFCNITIEIAGNTVIYLHEISELTYGLLAAENNGVITNAYVYATGNSILQVASDSVVSGDVTVAGLVGVNELEGSITNSRVEANFNSFSTLAGVVGTNKGIIASTYFKNGSLVSTSQNATDKVAGFVIENSSGGKIITSYVSGVYNGSNIYADNQSKSISATQSIGGFVYSNGGEISDCYTNIPIPFANRVSGFVFINSGKINNSYTTSKLPSNVQVSYPFVQANMTTNKVGTIENCFYLLDVDINFSTADNTYVSGLTMLKKNDFAPTEENLTKYFSTFGVSTVEKTRGIWFIPNAGNETEFIQDGTPQSFRAGRLELVAPNIIVNSYRILDELRTQSDPVTGEILYAYKTYENSAPFGSKYNPYILFDRDSFENEIYESSNGSQNENYFRVVSPINYDASVSKLFRLTFLGDIEGNGMTVSNFILDSSLVADSGGLFAQIGTSSMSKIGSLKNLVVQPNLINLPNMTSVGGVTGTLDYGYLFNIEVDGFIYGQQGGRVIVGKNVVGGMVGRVLDNSKLFNIKSKASASAQYSSSGGSGVKDNDITYTKQANNIKSVSYAGAIAGITEGKVDIKYAEVSGDIVIIAEKAGAAFGRIGTDVSARFITVEVNTSQSLKAHFAGGIIAGELAGILMDSTIKGNERIDMEYFQSSKVPIAVGGAVGIMKDNSSGKGITQPRLERVKTTQSFTSKLIKNVGGLVGMIYAGSIVECIVEVRKIQSAQITGGVVGTVGAGESLGSLYDGTVTIKRTAVRSTGSDIGSDIGGIIAEIVNYVDDSGIYAGGIVGYVNLSIGVVSARLDIEDSYSQGTIRLTAQSYNRKINAFIGGFAAFVKEENIAKFNVRNSYSSGNAFVKMTDSFGNVGDSANPIELNPYIENGYNVDKVNPVLGESSKELITEDKNTLYYGNELGPPRYPVFKKIFSTYEFTNSYSVLGGVSLRDGPVQIISRWISNNNSLATASDTLRTHLLRAYLPKDGTKDTAAALEQTEGTKGEASLGTSAFTPYTGWSLFIEGNGIYNGETWKKASKNAGLPYLAFEENM